MLAVMSIFTSSLKMRKLRLRVRWSVRGYTIRKKHNRDEKHLLTPGPAYLYIYFIPWWYIKGAGSRLRQIKFIGIMLKFRFLNIEPTK